MKMIYFDLSSQYICRTVHMKYKKKLKRFHDFDCVIEEDLRIEA